MSKQQSKIADKKKNDLLKKFLNAQQYTKNLKKNASNLKQDSNYATYSYDQIQTYPEIPQSAKLPSTILLSKEITYSMNTMNDDYEEMERKVKTKKQMYRTTNQLSMSSNEMNYPKSKKSAYSQMEKSVGASKILKKDIQTKSKPYDVHSQTKEKHSSMVLDDSTGQLKMQSFFKLKNKKSFNYSHANQCQSQKLSGQAILSFDRKRNHSQIQQGDHSKLNKKQDQTYRYNMCYSNFLKLVNKVQQLYHAIQLYKQVIKQMRNKIISLQQQTAETKLYQIYIDSIKQQLSQQKNKSNGLRQKNFIQENQLKEYEKMMLESVQKIGEQYQKEISKMTSLRKQNQFLKFMLSLDFQVGQRDLDGNSNKNKRIQNQLNMVKNGKLSSQKLQNQYNQQEVQSQQTNSSIKFTISKNLNQLKNKIGIKQVKKKNN